MKKKRCISKRIISVFLILALAAAMCFGASTTVFAGDQLNPADIKVSVDGKPTVLVKGYDASYAYNTYVSIRDIASVLNGTEKQFAFSYDEESETTFIETGKPYIAVGGENEPGDGQTLNLSSAQNKLTIDDRPVKYYVYKTGKENDFYIKLVDLSLALNLSVDYTGERTLSVDTSKNFSVDIWQLDKDGYFSSLHGVVIGNADSGKILYSCKADNKAAIASTTKLMTYLLVMEAVDDGRISMDDTVVISENVEKESYSEDYVIHMHKGQKASLQDLLVAMLIPSSNEAALALAEHVSGSEAVFVDRMNERAAELGLTSAIFYNPHGLPDYTSSAVTSKRQNSMNAKDLFKLSRYVINKYPQITEITSQPSVELQTLNYQTTNTNPLIYNMEGVVGLKTGTTNRAGCCLISAIPVQVGEKTQMLIAVELGAETNAERGEKSAVMLKYAQQYYAAYNAAKEIKLKASASPQKKAVVVKWTATGNTADGYEIYRSVKKSSGYVKKFTAKGDTYKNTAVKKGRRYYYKVRAYKMFGGEKFYSGWSNIVTAAAK